MQKMKVILFSNILFTEGEINKRYRELASCFHPDRTTYSNTLNELHSNDQYLGIELFRIILEIKEALLTDLETTLKSQARKEYRAACKVADAARELKKQIKLRGIMALCSSQEDILRSNEQSVGHKIVGAISLAAVTMGTGAFVAASTIFAPVVSTLWLVPLMSLLYHLNPWKRGTMLLSEPEIREKLNKIIKNALDAYDEGNYQNFFDLLCEEYKEEANLIKLKDPNIIDPKYIINSLLSHGFRSDGIAY
ncbi:hypothetical protein F8M41_006194 [Gigaspora margarita]|uniref:J domain-containing protein n=1 Tax=Gigaspora margarita TaxID=4874 RepID=A0A8H4A5H3_GIGMA|nr:hypothetical protein F8M41_006194 [Gigaspora margarita]